MKDPFNSTQAKALASYYSHAPTQIIKGEGVYLYDINNSYLDCGMALGSVSLGYAYKEVDDFVISTIKKGVNFSRPSYLEEELTHTLGKDIGNKDLRAKYSKSSSMLLSVIPRIARFFTKKKYIAYPQNCFLGNTDWYLSKCKNSGGIIEEIQNHTLTFKNGDCNALEDLFASYKKDLACIVMEPYREKEFSPEFYQTLKSLCELNNVMLIFDETITGYRFCNPLAQTKLNCIPDFTVIGKAFANGYALASVVANKDIMSKIEREALLGNIFDFSTTHAGETIGLAAAIRTLDIYSHKAVVKALNKKGKYIYQLFEEIIYKYNLQNIFQLSGQPTYFKIICSSNQYSQYILPDLFGFFFKKHILFKGVISVCLSHENKHLEFIADCFEIYCKNFDFKKLISIYSN